MCAWQDLAAQLAAAAGGHAAGPVAPAEDNAALRKELAELEAQLAAVVAEANRLQDENLDLSVAVAAHSCDTAKLEEMAEVLEVTHAYFTSPAQWLQLLHDNLVLDHQ